MSCGPLSPAQPCRICGAAATHRVENLQDSRVSSCLCCACFHMLMGSSATEVCTGSPAELTLATRRLMERNRAFFKMAAIPEKVICDSCIHAWCCRYAFDDETHKGSCIARRVREPMLREQADDGSF